MDKTNFTPRLENYNASVSLRPCRFGKSLLVSTLVCYYDRIKAGRFEELFGGTWIGEYPMEEYSRYMAMCYGFSAIAMANDTEGLERNFNLLNCFPVEIMVIHNRDLFQDSQFTTKGNAFQMLEEALGYVREYGLPKVYTLIDEHDNSANQLSTVYKDPLHEQIATKDSFLRTSSKVIKKRRITI